MTLKTAAVAALAAGLSLLPAAAEEKARDGRLYELRTYHAAPGKLDALLARFREHTCALFARHGMTNVGYWTPLENEDRLLIYLLSYPDRAARDAAWENFRADEDWIKAKAASEEKGALVERIDELFLAATDFSPGFPATAPGAAERVYELRTYTTEPGRLPALHKRFREHTLGLFVRHGMTNAAYFQPVSGQPAADDTLVYFLIHRDAEAAEKSFTAFRADPEWIAAKKASEEAAGGSLTVPDGVKSVLLKPVDFSPAK